MYCITVNILLLYCITVNILLMYCITVNILLMYCITVNILLIYCITVNILLIYCRDAVYINGIRTTEFFVDHDKFHCGIITENQFICGLSLCISQKAHLTREEINSVIKYFSTSDGRVKYKEFCDIMENGLLYILLYNVLYC